MPTQTRSLRRSAAGPGAVGMRAAARVRRGSSHAAARAVARAKVAWTRWSAAAVVFFIVRVATLMTLVVAGAASHADAVAAHGPCRCLKPSTGPPGAVVRFDGSAFKVVFNPDRPELPIGPRELWRAHKGAVAPIVVFRRSYTYAPRPRRVRARWSVPTVPPGRYPIAIYDGTEGGAHYTWDFFEVTNEAPRPGRAEADVPVAAERDEVGMTVVAVVAGLSLAIGAAIGGFVGYRQRRRGGFQ